MPRPPNPPTLLDHVVLEVRDPEASARFYERMLGFAPVRLEAYRAGEAPFLSARINDQTVIDFFPPKMWRTRRRAGNPNHLCLTLTARQCAALRRRLAREGVSITNRLRRSFGAQGYGVSIYFDDPDGVSVEARYYGPAQSRSSRSAARSPVARRAR
jgi:catechol 2,3-dioxygenase-like lactoylglutathione lyase family enzyme